MGQFSWLELPSANSYRLRACRHGALRRRLLSPDLSPDFLAKVAFGTVETLAISALGTLLAIVAGCCWHCRRRAVRLCRRERGARLTLNFLRSVPELVWATLMVLLAGLGPFAGVLALALHTARVLGRLFAEALENSPGRLKRRCASRAPARWRRSATA